MEEGDDTHNSDRWGNKSWIYVDGLFIQIEARLLWTVSKGTRRVLKNNRRQRVTPNLLSKYHPYLNIPSNYTKISAVLIFKKKKDI